MPQAMGSIRVNGLALALAIAAMIAGASGFAIALLVPPETPAPPRRVEGIAAPVAPSQLVDSVFTPIAPPSRRLRIRTRLVHNYNTRPSGTHPFAVVMHATGSGERHSGYSNLSQLRRRFNGAVEVSAHYGIDRKGRVMQFVPDDKRAWHTAAPGWNDVAIGIEMLNDNSGKEPFPPAQVEAARLLVQELAQRHDIPLEYVVRHRDVQPWDRSDPASNFPWKRFRASLRHT
jgi:N-acetylmuramoyl-L-alanine amidase